MFSRILKLRIYEKKILSSSAIWKFLKYRQKEDTLKPFNLKIVKKIVDSEFVETCDELVPSVDKNVNAVNSGLSLTDITLMLP